MKTRKLVVITLIMSMIIGYLIFDYFYSLVLLRKDSNVSCSSNVHFNFSDGVSPGPIFEGVLNVNFKGDGSGLMEISGIVKWQGKTSPVSKRITVKHDLNSVHFGNLLTIQAVSSLSLEHDKSPPGLIEKYLIGDPLQPARILRVKRVLDNGYVVSNLNSPIMICIDR